MNVTCPVCGRLVKKENLRRHQQSNIGCAAMARKKELEAAGMMRVESARIGLDTETRRMLQLLVEPYAREEPTCGWRVRGQPATEPWAPKAVVTIARGVATEHARRVRELYDPLENRLAEFLQKVREWRVAATERVAKGEARRELDRYVHPDGTLTPEGETLVTLDALGGGAGND